MHIEYRYLDKFAYRPVLEIVHFAVKHIWLATDLNRDIFNFSVYIGPRTIVMVIRINVCKQRVLFMLQEKNRIKPDVCK